MQGVLFREDDGDRLKRQRKTILSMLEAGPQTNMELVPISHRFSTHIDTLRQQGYKILTKPMGGGLYKYILEGFKRREKATKSLKSRYYATAHWKTKRRERLEFDGWKCCNCKSTKDLHVHHWFYELFNEDIEDLMTLCKVCHERLHAYDKVSIGFPKSLSEEQVERIKSGA